MYANRKSRLGKLKFYIFLAFSMLYWPFLKTAWLETFRYASYKFMLTFIINLAVCNSFKVL